MFDFNGMCMIATYGIVVIILLVSLYGIGGKKCPKCKGTMHHYGITRDDNNSTSDYINWICENCGHSETEVLK